MLNNNRPIARAAYAQPADGGASLLEGLDLAAMMAMARRHVRLVGLCILLAMACAGAYLVFAEPRFTSQSSILIGNRQIRAVQDNFAQNSLSLEATLVDSEIQVMQSERVLLNAVRTLKLTEDPFFNGTMAESFVTVAMRMVRRAMNPAAWFSRPSQVDQAYRAERIALSRLNQNIKISRVGKSNVVQISVTLPRAAQAAQIANGIAEAYLSEQLAARFEATRRAGEWFNNRIEELRLQSEAAQLEVEKFRAESNLLTTGGILVSDQQLQQLNAELAAASIDRVRKQARYDSIQSVLSRGDAGDLVTDALDNSVITQLRQRYGDVSKRLSEITQRVGPRHEQAIALRQQMSEFNRLIVEELRRIDATFKNDLEVAANRERAIRASLDEMKQVAASNNNALVRLRQLEQEATSLRNLHQSFLQRYQETIQQETFPINDARVVAIAARALQPSEPNPTLVMALGLILGAGLGAGLAGWRELSERSYRSPQQIEEDLGLPVFGPVPVIGNPDFEVSPKLKADEGGRAPRLLAGPRQIEVSEYTIEHPFSGFAETLRAAKVAIDQQFTNKPHGKIIGVVSTLPREGKSVISKNFASLLALQGSKTLLIDGDLRHAGLTAMAAPAATTGLVDILTGRVSASDVVIKEPRSGLNIIPAIVPDDLFQSAEFIRSNEMRQTLDVMTKIFDYVIIDLPPLGPVTDARAAADLIDAFLLVVEWGNVPRRVIQETLAASGPVAAKTIGVILNKAELSKMRLYQPYGLEERQMELYNSYYK
jgi:succinoglycan biosynthesis transport protein ExoP